MSRPYGPIALTAATASSVDIDASASWVIIENSSLFLDLGVSFQVNQPPVVATFSGMPYVGVIQAGAARRFLLPVADGTWTGRIWLLPLSVASQSAQTGTGSTYSRAYVTSYMAYEEPTDNPSGVIRGLDLTSQPRIISVPMTPTLRREATFTLAANPEAPVVAQLHLVAAIKLWTTPPAACNNYVHRISAHPTTVGRCTIYIWCWYVDVASNPLVGGSVGLMTLDVWRAGRMGPAGGTDVAYPNPPLIAGSVPPAASFGVALFQQLGAGDGGMTVDFWCELSSDTRNGFPMGGIGSPASSAGTLY